MTDTNNQRIQEVQSPCIGVCAIDSETGFCHGCYRTLDEIQAWWDLDAPSKQRVVEQAEQRQLAVFD